ncbi:type 1 glutamine amidotransferase family protein, partial [Vibrio cholerae]
LVSFKHTNFDEALAIADIFDSLGYQVDVIDYNCESKIDYSQYDIIFGFGEPFQRSFSSSKKLIRIFYGTGMNVNVQNANAMLRLNDFYSKHSIWLPSSVRYVSKQWALQYSFSNTILALGNQYCADSYRKFTLKSEVYQIPSFYYQRHDA